MVAPYEADAQLAYLTKNGLAQAVITEDSDLLAFGCKKVRSTRPRVHFQLHKYVDAQKESPLVGMWIRMIQIMLTI